MSALGHKRTSCHGRVMSVLPLKTDVRQREWHVRLVPLADIVFRGKGGRAKARVNQKGLILDQALPLTSAMGRKNCDV